MLLGTLRLFSLCILYWLTQTYTNLLYVTRKIKAMYLRHQRCTMRASSKHFGSVLNFYFDNTFCFYTCFYRFSISVGWDVDSMWWTNEDGHEHGWRSNTQQQKQQQHSMDISSNHRDGRAAKSKAISVSCSLLHHVSGNFLAFATQCMCHTEPQTRYPIDGYEKTRFAQTQTMKSNSSSLSLEN